MPIAVAAAAAAILGDAALLWLLATLHARTTDRALLTPRWPRRAARAYRSFWVRRALWWPSWPHALNRLLPRPPREVFATPSAVVWRRQRATITRPEHAAPATGEPVLLVHSLVTMPWILDLLPGRSVLGGLRDAGLDVHLFDWGDPDPATAATQGWSEYAGTLAAAVAAVAQHSPTGRVHVVGYCMGGSLALDVIAQYGAGPVASLTLIAPPIDTAVPGGVSGVLRSRLLMPALGLDGRTLLPPWVLREAFHGLRRDTLRLTYARFRRRTDRGFQQIAGALERWAWQQRALGGALFFDLVDYYRTNPLAGAGPLAVDVPVLVAVTDRDHIVPIASSLALTRLLPREPEVVRCPAGHVSMLMGAESRTTLLPSLVAFLRRHGA